MLQVAHLWTVLNNISDGVVVLNSAGLSVLKNSAAAGLLDFSPEKPCLPGRFTISTPEGFGFFLPDGFTPVPEADFPVFRALVGETIRDVELFYRDWKHPTGRAFLMSAFPTEPKLKDSDVVVILRDISERLRAEQTLKRVKIELEAVACKDPLTGLYNRREMDRTLPKEFERSLRYGCCLSVLLLDIDLFKTVNDNYGHLAGDVVLKSVSAMLTSIVRDTDTLIRYGGEEILILLPETDVERAIQTADRIRYAIEQGTRGAIPITVSIGVASSSMVGNVDALLALADTALYRAKATGRNKVVLAKVQK